MKLWEYSGKAVRIVLKDGSILKGAAYDYTSALDNEPDSASITIGDTEIFEEDIQNVTRLS